jgi:FkbM family methyltransferase
MSFEAARDCYQSYLVRLIAEPSPALQATVEDILSKHSLENPSSSIDYNNLGVIALIEAESSSEAFERSSLLALAHEYFLTGYQLDSNPLCRVHLAMVYWLSGEAANCVPIAFNAFISSLHLGFSGTLLSPAGMVYFPSDLGRHGQEMALPILLAESAYVQARILACHLMLLEGICFYNGMGLRVLEILRELLPDSIHLKWKYGVSLLISNRTEGLLYLHESCQRCPNVSKMYQALYLGYRVAGNVDAYSYWRKEAITHSEGVAEVVKKQDWRWTSLPDDSPFTYLLFDGISLSVEASLRSFVTSVLLVDEDWFEPEMKLWRSYLKPGMVVIDVGANVGVYTFSAAARVGATGRVIAVEPTALCVQCLHQTIQINDLQQVSVYAVAASDTEGSLSFRISANNELNEVVASDVEESGLITIPCLSLDAICEKENIQRVDFIKIDAEGHELSVLKGALHILATFQPVILYENVAGVGGLNLPVYDFLQTQGYQLYRYRSFSNDLIHIESTAELSGLLNVIAISTRDEVHIG